MNKSWMSAAASVMTVLLAVPAIAADHGVAARRPATRSGAATPMVPAAPAAGATLGARATSILGTAWDDNDNPIKQAHLRLRNVINGRIEAATVADDAGQFTFTNIEGGTYVVELVHDNGHIMTVGHVFTIAPGETVATFVRLGPKVPWFTGFFNNAASAAASSAASQGVTAIAPVVRPASANNK